MAVILLKPQCVTSLWLSDHIWRHGSGSTLAWCLMASSHYWNRCWVITKSSLWNSPEGISQEMFRTWIHIMITRFELVLQLPGSNELTYIISQATNVLIYIKSTTVLPQNGNKLMAMPVVSYVSVILSNYVKDKKASPSSCLLNLPLKWASTQYDNAA